MSARDHRGARVQARTRCPRWLWLAWPLLACGEGSPGPSESLEEDGDGGDGGALEEAGPSFDGDAGVLPDGGPAFAPECRLDPIELREPIDDAGHTPWDLALVGDTFYIAYQQTTCGESGPSLSQGLRYRSFKSSGPFSEPSDFVNTGEMCLGTRSPALGATKDRAPLLYYAATNAGSFELFRRELAAEQAERLTQDDSASSDVEELIRTARFGDTEVVAYANDLPIFAAAGHGELVTRALGGAERPLVARAAKQHFTDLGLAAFPGPAEGGVAAWMVDAPVPAIQLQYLGATGEGLGVPLALGGLGSNLDLTTRLSAAGSVGAVVYAHAPGDARHTEIQFRSFDAQGTLSPEVPITSGDRNARDVGISAFANGYVVAYRQVSGLSPKPVIQLSFVSLAGRKPQGGERNLAEASSSGGEVRVLEAPDGRLVVAFADRTESGLELRVLRANCLE